MNSLLHHIAIEITQDESIVTLLFVVSIRKELIRFWHLHITIRANAYAIIYSTAECIKCQSTLLVISWVIINDIYAQRISNNSIPCMTVTVFYSNQSQKDICLQHWSNEVQTFVLFIAFKGLTKAMRLSKCDVVNMRTAYIKWTSLKHEYRCKFNYDNTSIPIKIYLMIKTQRKYLLILTLIWNWIEIIIMIITSQRQLKNRFFK